MDLFEYMSSKNKEKESPLAARLRPRNLDEVVGQKHILEKAYNEYLARAMELLPDLLIMSAYSTVMMGMSMAGVILMLVKRRKFFYKPAEFQLPGDRVGSTVYMNIGVFTLILVCAGLMVYALM